MHFLQAFFHQIAVRGFPPVVHSTEPHFPICRDENHLTGDFTEVVIFPEVPKNIDHNPVVPIKHPRKFF